MDWNYFPQRGHAETSGGWIQWLKPVISLWHKQTKHTKQQSTCSAGLHLSDAAHLLWVSKLPVHLIRAPLENSSPYHRSPCPSRRHTEQEALWLSRLELVQEHAVCIVWQGTAREKENWMERLSIKRRKWCEKGAFICLSFCSINKKLPLIELHTDKLLDRHSENWNCDTVLLFCQTEQNSLPGWQVLCVRVQDVLTGTLTAKLRKVHLGAR